MRLRFYILAALLPAILIFVISCSSSSINPISPSGDLKNPKLASDSSSGKVMWGTWDVVIDPVNESINVVPLRGVEFMANVTVFLQPPMGKTQNLKFSNLDLAKFFDEGLIDLDVSLTHPFPGLNYYTGFDVMGVFRSDGDFSSAYDFSATWPQEGVNGVLLNPDGLTRWFNPTEFTLPNILGYVPGALGTKGFIPDANVCYFKYFADGLDKDVNLHDFFAISENCEKRGCFTPGSTNTRHYSLQFPFDGPAPVLKFQYTVIASYEPPDEQYAPDYPPEDFPISANLNEALILNTDTSESTVFYIDETTKGGSLKINLEILDRQGAVSQSGVTGDIAGIVIDCPYDLIPGGFAVIDQAALEAVAEPGGPSSSVYQIDIPNCNPDAQTVLPILLTVLSANPSTYYMGFDVPYPEDAELAGYMTTSVLVSGTSPGLPPVGGDLSLSWDCPGDPCSGKFFTVEISEAYDPDGNPVTITWDFDGNMDYADDMDGDDTNLSAEYVYDIPGDYECWCKIDDGTSFTEVGPLPITVLDCIPDSPSVLNQLSADGQISYDVAYNPNDGYAYCAVSTGSSGSVWVIDVDPIADTAKKGQVNFTYLQDAIACKGTYVYVGGVYLNGIATIDASDPANPVVVNTYYQGLNNAMINDLEIVNDYLYAAAQWGGILVFDITNPGSPVFVGQTPGGYGTVINSSAVAVTSDNQWGFYTDGYEINPDMDDYVKAVDLSNPANPTVVKSVMVHYHFNSDMDIQGDYLYLTETGYFTVFDISDPANMDIVFTDSAGFGGSQYDIDVNGSYAYMVNGIWGSGTLTIIDISDPLSPEPFISYGIPGGGQGVNEYCGKLYIAASYNALDIIGLY